MLCVLWAGLHQDPTSSGGGRGVVVVALGLGWLLGDPSIDRKTGWRLEGRKERVGTGAVRGGASPPSSAHPS